MMQAQAPGPLMEQARIKAGVALVLDLLLGLGLEPGQELVLGVGLDPEVEVNFKRTSLGFAFMNSDCASFSFNLVPLNPDIGDF